MMTSTIYPEDEPYENPHEERMANAFADAVTRLEAGDEFDAIVASLEVGIVREMRSLLRVGEFLIAMQLAPLPVRNPRRLQSRRTQFMEQIALERTRQEVALGTSTRTVPAAGDRFAGRPEQPQSGSRATSGGALAGLAGWWNRLQESLTLGNLRLAPVIVTLTFALTSVLGLWRVSTASLPGDLAYPIKAWVTMMNLSMTSPELRAEAAQASAAEIQSELVESARRAQERGGGGQVGGATRQESIFLVFEGYDGRLLKFGDIRVVPSYQPDPSQEARSSMEVEGDLQPGAPVWLTVQILPGQADIVQGVRAEVQNSVVRGEEPATPVACTANRPAGWVNYTVLRGDSLAALSESSGAPAREIAGANCLDSDAIFAGQLLFLPR